ncbi:MAG: PEGA domain-containing protein, partial [Verrucomicrobia bacterium]|nr:PEGA domain-containing protein [Verrucomicrobiota bacterium]
AKVAYAHGSVVLTTEPAGVVADVYAGETKLGQTPYRVEMAKAGPVKYRVQAEDYLAQMVEGEVVAGKVNQLVAKLKLAQATLELRSDPAGAEAYLDGQLLGKLPLTKAVDVGTRNLEVRYPGLKPQTRQVKLKKGQTIREEFKFVHGGVVLTTEPTGAEVALGGRVLGTTPYTNLFVDIGDIPFKLTKGTLTKTQTLQVQEGQVTTNHVVLTAPPPTPPPATNVVAMVRPPGKGSLAFTSDPPGAEVLLGTNSLGVTGANALRVPFDPGLKQFVLRHPVLGEQTASLMVRSDVEVATNIVFAYGGVLVRTEPPVAGAEVFLGNNKMGPAPWSNLVVKLGPVQFEVRATGYETNMVEGAVAARQVRELVARLKRLPPDVGKPFKNSVGMELEWVADVPDAGKGCWVGKYEVTQEEYKKVMGADPSETKGTRLPVMPVSFNQAMQFCQKLTTNEDRSIRYTLPTEAQWIYLVADAKLEDAVVSKGQPQKREHPEAVGSTGKPNKFGIFDIRGNVWEWCEGPNPQKAVKGGAFDGLQEGGFMGTLGINYRRAMDPALPPANVGFRVIVLLTR